MTAAGFMFLSTAAHAQTIDPNTTPTGGNVISGGITIDQQGTNTNIYQQEQNGRIDWQSFDHGSNAVTEFHQPNSSSWTINKVIGNVDASKKTIIDGKIIANGNIGILDQNGVLYGPNADVNLGGGFATSGELDENKFDQDGTIQIDNVGAGGSIEISEGAQLNFSDGGLAAFVAPTMVNAGVISAKMGTVAMAAGETVTLDLYGDGLVEVTVDGELNDALIENKGAINAEGGNVLITARAAKNVVDNIINVSGIVDVSSVSTQGGKIVLEGGDAGKVQVTGILDASGTTGGDIEVTGQFVSAEESAVLDASGINGGGTIHFGGDWQGQGDTPTSEYAFVGQNAILNANSEEDGDGGEVVVWSDKVTQFFGLITAKGGAVSGDGGQVETSSKGVLQSYGNVNASAANGNAGEWLLDPRNLEVDNGNNNSEVTINTVGNPDIITASSGSNSNVDVDTIEDALEAGTSITLRTALGANDGDPETGDIIISSEINKNAGGNAILRMEAHDDIIVNQGIIATAGQLVVELLAGFFDGTGTNSENDVRINATINTNGGDLEVGADRDITGSGTILTEGGRVVMVAGGNSTLPISSYTVSGANTNSNVLFDGDIDTDGGQVLMNAGDDIRIGGEIKTDGGAATFIAEGDNSGGGDALSDVEFKSTGSLNTTRNGANNDGSVFIQAENFINDGFIVARDSTVTLGRSTLGDIDVGDNNGAAYNISQNEIRRTIARNLIIGDTNTNNVTVDNVDMHSQVTSAQDNLPPPSQGCENSGGNNPNCTQTFETRNTNLTLKANNLVDIIGTLTMGTGTVTVDAPELDLDARIQHKTTVNGAASDLLDDARLIGTQQLDQINVLSNNARIQQAIYFADSTAQKTINIANDTYTENLLVNKGNLKIDGAPGATIQAADGANNAIMLVTASNVNIDPIIFDGNFLVNYGIFASGVGANGLIVDGNTFREFNVAGVHVDNNTGGTSTIKNNIFEGTMPIGVQLGTIAGNSVVDIFGNDIGTLGDRVNVDGISITSIATGGDVNVYDNDIFATLDGIYVDGSITGAGTTMLIAGNRIDGQQDGVDLGLVSTGAVVNVGGTDRAVDGFVGAKTDDGNIIKAGTNGIEFDGGINSTVNIDGNKIHAGVDGVNIRDDADATGVDGATVNIRNNDIGSDGTDTVGFNGIHFIDSITNGATVRVAGNKIGRSGARVDNGVIFDGAINGANTDVQVENGNVIWADVNGVVVNGEINGVKHFVVEQSTINANSHGVHINGNVVGAQNLQVNVNNITSNNNHGVFFNGNVSNSLVIVNGNTNIDAFEDGVRFGGTVTGGDTQVQGNNIKADDHGVAFIGAVSGGAALHLHDNVIIANEDNAVVGSGFYFGGPISSATINIGDGERDSNPSNFITVAGGGDDDTDGIHFAGTVGTGAVIKIDGNRIGYNGNGTVNAIKGDGIEFAADVNGNADIDIIDNRVRAIGNPSGTGDGVKFSGHIGGTANVAVGVASSDGNNIDVTGDGVEFNGITGGTVSVASNTIVADENGVEFGAGSPSIEGGADVFVLSNTINATLDGIYVDDDITGAGTTFTAKRNTITADDDGIDIDNVRNGAVVNIGGPANGGGGPLNNEGNRITANGNGIEFDAGIDATVLIQKNRISAGDDGINVRDDDGGHTTAIDTGAIVNILDNTIGFEGPDTVGRHGIHVEEDVVGNSTINIGRNNIGRAGAAVDNGIHFGGVVNGSTVNIFSNNHGIHADGHGIYFGGNLVDADIDINDNIINADDDDSGNGDGIRFDGQVSGSTTVNIGDGLGSNLNSGSSNIISGEDGIHFAQDIYNTAQIVIDGNRIGYDGLNVGGTVNPDRVGDDGIEFADWVYDASNVTITDNWILSEDEGVVFNDVYGTGKILIGGDVEAPDGNHIDADGDGIQFSQGVHGQRLVEISYNEIDADNDGIAFLGTVNNALNPANSEQELLITRNDIWGDRHGIHFAGAISNARHDTVISYNTIEGEDEQGVVFDSSIDDAHIRINNNTRIEGEIDGVRFLGEVDSAQIDINDNIRIQGNDEEAIHFFQEIDESTVNIIGNDNLLGGDHGIEFAGIIDESNITISGNNDGIHADNHGILFGAAIEGDSVINIHDNIISANEDGGAEGDGIHFAGTVTESDIFIGDGFGSSLTNNPSNVISGVDGIHFAANIGENADIVIDGNRIGYNEPRLNPTTGPTARVTDDGISFAFLSDNAEITVTDNWIRSADDGIIFNNNVDDDVQVLIGGDNEAPDGNHIDAWGDGIQFRGDIEDDSLIEISYNDIEADDNGIEFNGTTSNDDDTFPFRDDEILIAYNSIEADENGVAFFGRAEDERHDIMIRDNVKIHGHGGHGILHTGGIDDAELRILDNDDIFGDVDGIHITGAFSNDALVTIDDNTVDSGSGDGIEVTQSGGGGGVDLNITDNHIHFTGDNGIEIDNVDNVWIANNRIHDAGADGIYVEDSDNAQIRWNRIRRTGDDGIDVRRSNGANIEDNRIRRTQGDGIQVRNSSFVEIDDNRIRFAGDDGIDYEDGFFSTITDNNIRFANHNGIEINDSAFILIDGNEVADADEAGIFIDPSAVIFVTNNDLHDNDIGLHVDGPGNGYINVTGNTFTDNRVGARFESGIIDLTGISSDPSFGGYGNKFIGGQHGIVFDDAGSRRLPQLSLVRTGGFFVGGHTYDGNPYDTFDGTNIPGDPGLNFGGTIGSQYFEGQTTSFVTLRSGTFVDPATGNAIWLDASDSTFFMPGEGLITGDVLTQAQADFLESMFRHWPDVNNRGIFWFGAVPSDPPQGPSIIKDPEYDPFNGGVSGLNVTITALPRLSGGAAGPTGAAGLNAINPAAGDESSPADLANIEPAAGAESSSQNASCWGDAVSAAGAGGPVNYSYGGTFEESIAAAASCGSESF